MTTTPPQATSPGFVGRALSLLLCIFVLVEVNYPTLSPHCALSLFTLLGLALCFLGQSRAPKPLSRRVIDMAAAGLSALVCGYVAVQSEPVFSSLWLGGQSLGNRAGQERTLDVLAGALGVALVLEAARRCIGWTLPLLSMAAVGYALFGPSLPGWLFPHRGYDLSRIVSQTFLHSQGVLGVAISVMFTYVFLFIILGALLEATGATRYVVDLAQRIFCGSSGGAAKVAVVSSGLMGSLSGSAVANTATIGPFTIPMMRSSGFQPHVAAAVEAAASAGGALAPPVMGAAAYMMLELVDPPVTYLEIIRAAAIPALLYYLSLLFLVHFHACRRGAGAPPLEGPAGADQARRLSAGGAAEFEGVVFFGALGSLLLFLFIGFTPFRAVTISLGAILLLAALNPRTSLGWRDVAKAFEVSARSAVPLICAAACVGIVIGVATLTGIGTKLPAAILPLAQQNLPMALALIMLCSIVLGMGLPSAVCYLLLATLIGPLLKNLGVVPLAAHFFIFYFGMMSMVTPPVALAAYAAATIAGAQIMRTSFAAFRFALVGFTLPYMFVFRPQLLLLSPDGEQVSVLQALPATLVATLGVLALAAGMAGFFWSRLNPAMRLLFFLAAALLLVPSHDQLFAQWGVAYLDLAGAGILAIGAFWSWRRR